MRRTWRQEEGYKWDWVTPNQAYFTLCWSCHLVVWPLDMRSSNRHNKPGAYYWMKKLGGRTRLLAGDLYISEAPPELLAPRSAASVAAPSGLSSAVRSRSPRRNAAPRPGPQAAPALSRASSSTSSSSSSSRTSSKSSKASNPESNKASSSESNSASSSESDSDSSSSDEAVGPSQQPLELAASAAPPPPLRTCLRLPGAPPRAALAVTWGKQEFDDTPYPMDRVPVRFGSQACDHCAGYVGEGHHCASPVLVTLQNCDLKVAHSACLCRDCRKLLLKGEALDLHRVYEDWATALYSSRCSRKETLRLLGQPYTPKPPKVKATAKAKR